MIAPACSPCPDVRREGSGQVPLALRDIPREDRLAAENGHRESAGVFSWQERCVTRYIRFTRSRLASWCAGGGLDEAEIDSRNRGAR